MSITFDTTAINILTPKLIAVMAIMTKRHWRSFLVGKLYDELMDKLCNVHVGFKITNTENNENTSLLSKLNCKLTKLNLYACMHYSWIINFHL